MFYHSSTSAPLSAAEPAPCFVFVFKGWNEEKHSRQEKFLPVFVLRVKIQTQIIVKDHLSATAASLPLRAFIWKNQEQILSLLSVNKQRGKVMDLLIALT